MEDKYNEFCNWINSLETQTLTDELKEDIIDRAWNLVHGV